MLISAQLDQDHASTIDLANATGIPPTEVNPAQKVIVLWSALSPTAQAMYGPDAIRLVEQARAVSPDVVPAAGWADFSADELDGLADEYLAMAAEFDAAADIDDPVRVIEATATNTPETEITMTADNRMIMPNGKVVHVDQRGHIIPPAPNPLDDYAAAQRRTADRFGAISLANESDRGDAPNDWDETERRAAGELVEPSAERDAFVEAWARENSHLVSHSSSGIDGLAAPGRPMRAGVGFNADGSRGFHDQQSSVGYQLADEAFCRPGETEQDRQTRVAVDHAGEVIMQRAWAKDYCDRNMAGR